MATLSSLSAPHTTMISMPSTGDSPIVDAWKKALETYKKSLPQKDQTRIQMSTGPRDVVKDIEEWQLKQSKRKSIKVATVVGSGLARLQRFTASIDMLAQGSPAPGCLLWGSIKFVLTIVQDAVEEYQKLCTALSRMVDYLPSIEIYGETFAESALVRDCVVGFYVSVIQFWTQACKFYRRRRLWRKVRGVWDNYDTEFGLLEMNMISTAEKVEKNAAAVDMRQRKSERNDQQAVNKSILTDQASSQKKELIRWFSPTTYEVTYYQDDFNAALKKRHPDSCLWLLQKAQFIQFSLSQIPPDPLLWIYATPGAGKTVLSSYLIDHYQRQQTNLVYFFCKHSDEDKNTATSIIRSLLYQLLEVIEGPEYCGPLSHEIQIAMENSGQHRAVKFDTVWSLFAAHIRNMSQPLVILDALDECKEPKMLIQKLRDLSESCGTRVIITSRKETHIHKLLGEKLSLEIRPEDIDADIRAYIKAKVSKPSWSRHNSVHGMIVDKLSATHGGMFLWVYLILKELKDCATVQQVQSSLEKLPRKLPAVYEKVLQRLCESLSDPLLELAKKVFIWVASASRPLLVEEISDALKFHYRIEGHQLLTDEQSFPYADKDIELACGSLLAVREGTIQFIHLTVKEFLTNFTSSTNGSYKQLLVDPAAASLQMTLVSLDYMSERLTRPVIDLNAKSNRMDLEVDDAQLQKRLEENPFIEYASLNWPLHCVDYNGDSIDEIAKAIRKTFDSSATFYWIEICMLVDPDSFLDRIRLGLVELIGWASDGIDRAPPGSAGVYEFLSNWCSVIVQIAHDYGESFAQLPWDIYILDMREIFVSKGLGQLYNNHGNFKSREPVILFSDNHSQTSATVPNHLQIAVKDAELFIYDHVRKVFFTADSYNVHETLYVQEVKTGRRLPPVVDPEDCDGYIESYATSLDGEYLCILYKLWLRHHSPIMRISIWRLDSKLEFKKTMRSDPWARKVFSEESSWDRRVNTSVGYRDDGYFYTPIGRIQPATGTVLRFPPEIILDPLGVNDQWPIYFGAKGDVFVYGQKGMLRMYSQDLPIAENILGVQASPMGRYLVLTSGVSAYDFYDTTTKEMFKINQISRGSSFDTLLEFSKDDSQLFYMASYDHQRRVEALVFVLNDGEPQICSEVQIELADTCELANALAATSMARIDVCSDENSAWISMGQRIYQVCLGPPKVIFPQDLIMNLDFRYHYSRISIDGTRLSVLHYGDNKAQIQTFDWNIPGSSVRCLNLNWPHCDSETLDITLSQDLSVLVCGENLFHLAAEDRLASKSFPLFSPAPGQEMFGRTMSRFKHHDNPSIFISDDNPSMAYITFVVDVQPPFVHKVNLSSRCSTRVDISGINEFRICFAVPHPSLPLMLLIHSSKSEGTLWNVSTLDLNNLNVKCLSISQRCRGLYQYPSDISFSACGTFIYKNIFSPTEAALLGSLQTKPKPVRVIGNHKTLRYDGYYQLTARGRTNGIGVAFSAGLRPTLVSSNPNGWDVDSGPLISCPSSVELGSVRFLLGPTDDDLIRVLLLSKDERPLEIRTIGLTFSELRARLIHKWELEYEKPFEPEIVDVHPDAAAARVMERPDGSSNADLSPSDLITWFPGVLE